MLFGRMNPPTKGHEENIEGAKNLADKQGADHLVIASHSVDAKKNPLTPDVKLKHLKRAFPGTNITTSSKEQPTILHHASEAHKKGYTHLTVVAGADRVPEYEKLLKHYNGKFKDEAGSPLRHGGYNFKSIKVLSTGERKRGVSGTDMRNHAQNNDFASFHQNLSTAMRTNVQHARDLFRDVRKGMGLNENHNRGLFKAIFVTGGPGSGKDIVIREAIAEQKAVEITSAQAYNYLMDKQALAEKSNDFRRESIRNRGPLIINGPADDHMRMITIKEELEELGYSKIMVFVDTTNEASQSRNEKLTKMIAESVRQEKWQLAQVCKESYRQNFKNFINLNNSGSLENIEEDISAIYHKLNNFIDNKVYMEEAYRWLESHGKLNTNDSITVLVKENHDVKENSRFIQKLKESRGAKLRKTGSPAPDLGSISADNRASEPKSDDIKWDRGSKRGSYIFKTYTEETLKVYPEPKESNFKKDKETVKKKRLVDLPTVNQRLRNTTGIGPEFDTRQQGTVYPMSGLGDVTYREEFNFNYFRAKLKESHNDPADSEMGVGGTLGGASNKEPMENPKDKLGYTYMNLKNKKKIGEKK